MISRTSTPASAGRSSRPIVRLAHRSFDLLAGEQHEHVLEVRRAALALGRVAVRALDAEHRHRRAGAARVEARGARLGLDLGEPRRRPVDLDRLAARRARRPARRGGPVGDGLALRT